jgi:AsmA protein
VRGRLTLDRQAGDEALAVDGSFQNVGAGGLLWDAADCTLLNGQASGDFSAESRGRSAADLVRDLSGAASFRVRRGDLVGLDFEQALRRVEKRPLSVAWEVHGGRTSFDAFAGKLVFGDDRATLQDVALSGPGARVNLSGVTYLGEQALDIKAVAQQAGDDGAPSADGSRLTVKIEGYWDDPRLVLDVESLVRSSEAAAPLFAPAAATSPETK